MPGHDEIDCHGRVAQGDKSDARTNISESNNETPSKTAFHLHGDKAYILDQYILPIYTSVFIREVYRLGDPSSLSK
jgi:hypothetical protein